MLSVRKYFLFVVVITLGGLCFSCIPEPIDIAGVPELKPQIVVSSQVVPDQSILVLLTKSFGALQPVNDSLPEELIQQLVINDATVTITGPNGTDTLVALDNGAYGGVQILFQMEETYTLHVSSESLGEVTATTTVKPTIQFEEIGAQLYFNGFDDTLAQISYSIVDPSVLNWYMLNVQEVERVDVIENIINPRAYTRLVTDSAFNGGSFEESFLVVTRDYKVGDTIAVSLANISQDYYDFIKLRLDNRFSFVEFLGEPIDYPTNVVGGKGYFNLYVPDFRFFVLE